MKLLLPVLETLNNLLYILINKSPTKKMFPKIYLITHEQQKIIEKGITNKIYSAGLYFGLIKKGNFFLSIEGAEYLNKNHNISDFKIINMNVKGEKSILYGNNIFKNMILKIPEPMKQNELLLILNKFDELIALAKSCIDNHTIKELKPEKVIAFNLIDKGDYLRKSQ